MEHDHGHSDITPKQHHDAANYQLPGMERQWQWNGWRVWTVALASLGLVFTVWATVKSTTPADAQRIITTLASICGGGAIVTGFLWKLLGENSLTVIKMKDELISELRRTHDHDLLTLRRDIDVLKEELGQLKELNLALQRYNLDLTGERDDLLTLRDSLAQNLRNVTQEKDACEAKAGQLKDMLDLAQRRITILSANSNS